MRTTVLQYDCRLNQHPQEYKPYRNAIPQSSAFLDRHPMQSQYYAPLVKTVLVQTQLPKCSVFFRAMASLPDNYDHVPV